MKAYKGKDSGRGSFGSFGRVLGLLEALKGPRAQLAVAPDGNVVFLFGIGNIGNIGLLYSL